MKDRFRPFLQELLTLHWQGSRLITLGNEAFQWFRAYAVDAESWDAFWKRPDRYEAEMGDLAIPFQNQRKFLTLMPLPHPSPLNQRWYGQFPSLLDKRLAHS